MCRLSAISNKNALTRDGKFIFSNLVLISEAQGNDDGTGVITLGEKKMYFKTELPASSVVTGKSWSEVMAVPSRTIVAHNRAASAQFSTKIQTSHAHPHVEGPLWVCHNGMFDNYREVATRFGLATDLTDSQVFTKVLASKGELTPESIEESLAEMGPASYCLILGSSGEGAYVVRGSGRELYYAETPYGLIINTKAENLKVLVEVSALWAAMYKKALPEGEIKPIPEWSIWHLRAGKLEQIGTLEKAKKENQKPTTAYNKVSALREELGLSILEFNIMCNALTHKSWFELKDAEFDKFAEFCSYLAAKYSTRVRRGVWEVIRGESDTRSEIVALYKGRQFPWFLNDV